MMNDVTHIAVDTSLVPYTFDVELANDNYTFELHYNERHDFYTTNLYKDGQLIVAGEKIVYGQPLFANAYNYTLTPAPTIIPRDPSSREACVSKTNFGKTVLLTLDSEVDV